MTPKQLEHLTHQYNMEGNLNETCMGSLYSTINSKYYIPTLLYFGCDDPCFVFISRTIKLETHGKIFKFVGDIPSYNPECLTMIQAYKCYSMNDDKGIEKAIQNLVQQYKQIMADLMLFEMNKDFEDGTDEM